MLFSETLITPAADMTNWQNIIVSIITNLSIVGVIFILFKFTKNYSLILLISTLLNTIQGCILWKIVKKIMNN